MSPIRLTKKGKPMWRSTEELTPGDPRRRLLVVAMDRSSFLLRPAGTRQIVRIPFRHAYQFAAQLEARRVAKEKQARREARRKVRRGILAVNWGD